MKHLRKVIRIKKMINSVPQLGELRKTKLTLKQISKLRKMYDMRNYERTVDLKKIQAQFAPPPPAM